MPATAWSQQVRIINKALRSLAPEVNGGTVKIKVSSKPHADGSRPIDLIGIWKRSCKPSTRRLQTSLSSGNWTVELQLAQEEALAVAKTAARGQAIAVQRRASAALPEQMVGRTQLERQVLAAKAKLELRHVNKNNNPRQLREHLRWLALAHRYAERCNCELTAQVGAEAMLEHYKDRRKANYKRSVEIMRWIALRLGWPSEIGDELIPLYKPAYAPRQIPSDAELCERLKAIQDPEEQKLIYAIAVYGMRLMEIYSADWASMEDDGFLHGYHPKTDSWGRAWPIPFGDEQICLKGWIPPRFEELRQIGPDISAELAHKRELRSGQLSTLFKRLMGIEATAVRHRYGSVAIMHNIYPNVLLLARAMGNSISVIEKHYTRELDELMLREHQKNRNS